jgi:NodT family efflux transporter outer membrane factor (OMF) lipoprotein
MHMFKLTLLSAIVALAGCSTFTRTPYSAPVIPLPDTFEHLTTQGSATSADAWWRTFDEPVPDAWVELALAQNTDLATAVIRVERANLAARLAANALLPNFNSSVSTGAKRPLSGDTRVTVKSSTSTVGMAWEIDLFDRLGAQRDAAGLEALATAEDRDAVALSLVGTTVNLYWQLAFANERISLTEQSLAYAQRAQALIATQYAAGAVSGLERREADQAVAEQEAALSQLHQVRAELHQAFTVLFNGLAPSAPEPERLSVLPLPSVHVGLPAELLRRRPDLRAAELRLRSSLASSDAAQARYYPTLSLTGNLGTSSTALQNVLRNPVATLGADLILPFLNAREMHINTAIAKTHYQEAIVTFRKSLYTALTEVENALSARSQLALQEAAQLRVRAEATEIERLYEARYRAGQAPLRTWLDAQERRRLAQLAFATVHLAQLQNHVTLIQTLGGGMASP